MRIALYAALFGLVCLLAPAPADAGGLGFTSKRCIPSKVWKRTAYTLWLFGKCTKRA